MATARTIDGKALAEAHRGRIAERVRTLRDAGTEVRLDAVLASNDPGARLYAENQARTCERVGIGYRLHTRPGTACQADVIELVDGLNRDGTVSAVMVHLPLPEGVDQVAVQSRIAPHKDVEGVNPTNIGNIIYGRSSIAPCTALAALELIDATGVELRGRRAVVVGASNHVGKPIAVLLMRREATTISCNAFTEDLAEVTRSADVLVSAVGSPGLIRGDMVKPGAVVVDVGINRVRDAHGATRTVGDVDHESVAAVAGHLTPVPGGVGPMTVAVLLRNVADVSGRAVGPAGVPGASAGGPISGKSPTATAVDSPDGVVFNR